MDELVNFCKWQILSRLPKGNIFEVAKYELSKPNLDISDPYFYIYWLDIQKSIFLKYCLGTFGTINADYNLFISWLNNNYANGDFYEIKTNWGIIKLPIPFIEDYKCYKAEFLDIVMPSIVSSIDYPFLEGPYEYKDVVLSNGDVVFDLGANFGLFSSLARSHDCYVFAFEPYSGVVNNYLNRLALNDEKIKIVEKAVSNYTGEALFRIYSNKPSCNKLVLSETKNVNLEKISTISIDDFVSQNGLQKVDFIKADIEGAERCMLEGAQKTLREFAPKLAICYYHHLNDLRVLQDLILNANPNYEIDVKYRKIYARVRKK